MSGEGTVLVRRSALGDVVLLGSVTASAPRPVTVVTDAPYVALAQRMRGVDRAVAFGEHGDLVGLVVDLQASWSTRRAFPGAARVDKQSVRRRMWLWWGVGSGRPPVPSLYAAAVGVTAYRPPWFDLPRAPRDVLALVPGAAHAPKRPLPRSLVAAGRSWDGPIVVLGGPDDGAAVAAVAEALPGAVAVVERGFDETLSWLGRAKVCVSGDTGLMHLAAACGVPVVAIFGPTHPADGFGVHDGAIVQRTLGCRPCALHRVDHCAMGDLACMDLADEVVVAAVRRCAGAS
jgi:ADP-heptose:LPS heptosyltransferase